jgi:hypothetical protein
MGGIVGSDQQSVTESVYCPVDYLLPENAASSSPTPRQNNRRSN